jgi:integrase
MGRLINRLTEAKIRTLITKPGKYHDGQGLYLQVTSPAVVSWIFRFPSNGRPRYQGLGSLANVGLVKAREKAAASRAFLAQGIDPIEHSRTQAVIPTVKKLRRGPTFEECAERYMTDKLKHLRSDQHRYAWRYSLQTYTYPVIGNMPVDQIGTSDVLAVLNPIWQDKCETASRLRGRIERILARATVEGHRTGANPATWRGHLKEALPPRLQVQPGGHYAAMDYCDVPTFMADLGTISSVGAAALRFTVLTAARVGEVVGAEWDEIDWEEKTWAIPAKRTKAFRSHVVPLSSGALAILHEMKRLRGIAGNLIFPGRDAKPLSATTLLKLLRRRTKQPLTTHGMRSCFRDWCGDVGEVPQEIAEAALAHAIKDSTERAYRRKTAIERRRTVMQQWCDYCLPPSGSVVNIEQARHRATAA